MFTGESVCVGPIMEDDDASGGNGLHVTSFDTTLLDDFVLVTKTKQQRPIVLPHHLYNFLFSFTKVESLY